MPNIKIDTMDQDEAPKWADFLQYPTRSRRANPLINVSSLYKAKAAMIAAMKSPNTPVWTLSAALTNDETFELGALPEPVAAPLDAAAAPPVAVADDPWPETAALLDEPLPL